MPSDGASGGLISIWDDKMVCGEGVIKMQRILAISFRSLGDGFMWALANVYGRNEDREKAYFWDSLSHTLSQWTVPWG